MRIQLSQKAANLLHFSPTLFEWQQGGPPDDDHDVVFVVVAFVVVFVSEYCVGLNNHYIEPSL